MTKSSEEIPSTSSSPKSDKKVSFRLTPLRLTMERLGLPKKQREVLKEEEEDEDEEEEEEEDDNSSRGGLGYPCRFRIWDEFVIWASVIFYVADLCLDLWVCVAHFRAKKPRSAWFIFFAILLPNLYAGYKSLQWYLRAHAGEPLRTPVVWIIRVMFFPVSPLLRYWDAWRYGRTARRAWQEGDRRLEKKYYLKYLEESAEVSMLRLFIIFLEDAPISVINLTELMLKPPEQWVLDMNTDTPDPEVMRIGAVASKLACTMTLGVVHFMASNKMAWHAAHSGQNGPGGWRTTSQKATKVETQRAFLSLPAELCIFSWQFLAIGSRLVAYSMFTTVHQHYLWLLVSVRWTIHTLWIYLDVAEISLANSIAFGGVYLFTFVTTSPGRQVLRILLYYIITFSENIIIAILWAHGAPDNIFNVGSIGFVFSGTGGAVVFLSIYYAFFHPSNLQTWFWNWRKTAGRAKGVAQPMETFV
ncbi:XK-related protein 4-like [Oratosquilla oratoria]|uniref:XK-related protein 4-like n=1 Tax=Oratosquilla oratoria TaxID=337810 RepID=UPI003F75DFF4